MDHKNQLQTCMYYALMNIHNRPIVSVRVTSKCKLAVRTDRRIVWFLVHVVNSAEMLKFYIRIVLVLDFECCF